LFWIKTGFVNPILHAAVRSIRNGCGFFHDFKNAGETLTRRITALSEEVANQIAAGEVVERPASIVKELVENAIDAEASDIRVEIVKGGCEAVTVIDNGLGIEHEDVALVFERHATSKISKLDDLYRIGSFGFRGEAMASIASISRVELLTRRRNDLAGTMALAEAGVICDISPVGCPPGTQIRVTEIFANVPARRKFLKTEATEQASCLDAVARLALAHPEIRFCLLANGREVFVAPQASDIAGRIAMVLGEDFHLHCRPLSAQKEDLELSGFISTPAYTKSNSKSIYLFVNSRFVRDASLNHAVMSAYRQVIEPRRYPAGVLFLDVPGSDVDINVHPAKLEVRFKNARDIYELVSRAVAESLAGLRQASGGVAYRLEPRQPASVASGFRLPKTDDRGETGNIAVFSRQNLQRAIHEDLFVRTGGVSEMPASFEPVSNEEKITFAGRQYLGQFADTYLVFASREGVMLIDQHAAHERILLERLKASVHNRGSSQPLLMPEVVSLTTAQVGLFEPALNLLLDVGLEIEIFGRDAVVVKAMPAAMPHAEPRQILSDIADQLAAGSASLSLDERREKILASLACRAAVKANASLSTEEVAALCRDLEATPFNATCPHGRPVSVNISLYEIERMFKRK
jgi:DNA mismatch repair protein MutL